MSKLTPHDIEFWENAPEGATHYDPLDSHHSWVRCDPEPPIYYYLRATGWARWVDAEKGETEKLIPRPQPKQDKPQEWDGEGFPPVGVECEISNCGNNWKRCRINYMGLSLCVVDHLMLKDQHYHLSSVKFRSIKSAEQLAVEKEAAERDSVIKDMYLHATGSELENSEMDDQDIVAACSEIYRAGYRLTDTKEDV